MKLALAITISLISLTVPCVAGAPKENCEEGYSISSTELGGKKTRIDVLKIGKSEPTYSIVLQDVNSGHYHLYEFHNGNLYIIQRTGYVQSPSQPRDTWTDELWKYDYSKKGEKLFSFRGLDFRVSPNERYILVRYGRVDTIEGAHLELLDSKGNRIRKFGAKDFISQDVGNMYLTDEYLFFSEGACFSKIIKLNLLTFSWKMDDLSGLSFCYEYDFNPMTEKLVGSDFPFLGDVETGNQWQEGMPAVTLYLYDLVSKKKTVVSTSVAKDFNPQWLCDDRFQYSDPHSSQRITHIIGP